MRCPNCQQRDQARIYSSRLQPDGSVRRRHECKRCRLRWSSHEIIIGELTWLTPPAAPPDLPPDQPHCTRCLQWQTDRLSCGLGFPEARTHPCEAQDCLHYQAA